MKHVSLFGLPITALTQKQAVEEITRLTESKECQLVATVNCDFLATCWGFRFWRPKNPLFLKTLREAALLTADGMPLVWASKWIGSPLPERVTGQDLFLPLCKRLAAEDKSVFLLGGTERITQATVSQLSRDLPNLKIAGALSPQIDPQETPNIVQKINEAKPHLLFLQLGSPKQELWFAHNRHLLNVPVTIGIGGAFERYCGHTKRAPLWMQRSGLEWLFRLTQEPQRLFPRYLKDALTFTTHCLQWLPIHFLFSHPSSLQRKAAKIYDLQGK